MLPEFLKEYAADGEALFLRGCVDEVIFSGSTYQIHVDDAKHSEGVWAFLQFSDNQHLKDCLCTCHDQGDTSSCAHLVAAYLKLFNGHREPLHVRFSKSLWNHLCQQSASILGYSTQLLQEVSLGHYIGMNNQDYNVEIFASIASTQQHLKSLLTQRISETEETSIKFSNLGEEEILHWKEGRPSRQLLYELSFWSDIAKWLMLLQDEDEEYHIKFDYTKDLLPKTVYINFKGLKISFSLDTTSLESLIPSLETVKSPLKVSSSLDEGIEKIEYDRAKGAFTIVNKLPSLDLPKGALAIGDWRYVPKKGFYANKPHLLLSSPIIGPSILANTLDNFQREIERFLIKEKVHREPIRGKYALVFDQKWNLSIHWYLFELGDLEKPFSRDFGSWVYLVGDGFYPVEERFFESVCSYIPENKVSDFITSHKGWLNTQEGFSTHLANLPVNQTYKVDKMGNLHFSSLTYDIKDKANTHDFGDWVYVEGEGFYSKSYLNSNLPILTGTKVESHEVGSFIRQYKEELALLPTFFSSRCPILKISLRIELETQGRIVVTPHYEKHPAYHKKALKLFDEFIYVKGEGFYELPIQLRLPDRFSQRVKIGLKGFPLFLNYELDLLKNYASYIDPRLRKPASINPIVQQINKTDQRGWFNLNFSYKTEFGEVTLKELYNTHQKKHRFCFSSAGLIDLDDPNFHWIKEISKEYINDSGVLSISALEFFRIHLLNPLKADSTLPQEQFEDVSSFLENITHFRQIDKPNLQGLKSHMRTYQETGVEWLWFLYNNNLSGLLCDDMGLGKTHQAMALLTAVSHVGKFRYLVICPTSVIYHWEEKLQKFLPTLRIYTFHGNERSLDEYTKDYDLLITSYGIWRNEKERLKDLSFEVAIFDEIQVAKNKSSRIHSSLTQVKAKMKIGLSGTPIENRLHELKSLFDIVLPGYMPSETVFDQFFVKPIEVELNNERRQMLSRFIRPFLLRRKKEEVLLDLPVKTEEISYCPLLPSQQKLYCEALERSKRQLIEQLQDSAKPLPYVHVFALLTMLKQICNHPAVYLKQVENYQQYESGKWSLFLELFNEAQESDQKVVVFSQYLSMLDIMELHFKQQGIEYAVIRGSTVNRAEQLKKFNTEPSCKVFLGSLQAVGLGVDLTAASVVIHYDRWWNAARENQATDRVHRIGQTRGVQVFKLVTKGTFEERIDALITKKGKLMEEVVGADDQNVVKLLNREELIQLLQLDLG